jgi:hypothetical protein
MNVVADRKQQPMPCAVQKRRHLLRDRQRARNRYGRGRWIADLGRELHRSRQQRDHAASKARGENRSGQTRMLAERPPRPMPLLNTA